MKTKGLAFNIFQRFIHQVEYQSKKKFKYLFTNFGGEFINQTFDKYTIKENIK